MALFKRHLGLRVEMVAVVSALVVLGFEASASPGSCRRRMRSSRVRY
jgi:hypothetical protein